MGFVSKVQNLDFVSGKSPFYFKVTSADKVDRDLFLEGDDDLDDLDDV